MVSKVPHKAKSKPITAQKSSVKIIKISLCRLSRKSETTAIFLYLIPGFFDGHAQGTTFHNQSKEQDDNDDSLIAYLVGYG